MAALLFAIALSIQDDQLETIAAKALATAREHYAGSQWFDCIGQAEKSRNTYQTLVELYDSQGRTEERLKADEQIKICNQLIKLANDARKAAADKNAPPPKPAAPPEPPKEEPKKEPEAPKEPEIDPAVPPAAVSDFGQILVGSLSLQDAEKLAPVLKGLRELTGRWQNYGRAAVQIVSLLVDGTWTIADPDRPALKEYAEKFLTPPLRCDDRKAALFLAKAAESTEAPARWRLLRTLALLHVSEALKDPSSPLKLELASLKSLDINEEGRTREGESIALLNKIQDPIESWKKAAKVREPIRDVYKALSVLEAFRSADVKTASHLISETRLWFTTAEPTAASLLASLKTILEKNKPCRSCDGKHEIRCAAGCDESGERRVVCAKCGGKSFLQHPTKENKRRDICREPPPAGKKWEKDGHFCMVDCPACKGKALLPCNDCKAPWSGDNIDLFVKTEPCPHCSGGWLVEDVKLACYRCFGSGKKYTPKR